jgi:ParB family chromosome partitioning protein
VNSIERKQHHSKILIQELPISQIDIPTGQRTFGNLTGLVASIQRVGLTYPILVTLSGSHYRLIDGWRRYHACKRLGLWAIPLRSFCR